MFTMIDHTSNTGGMDRIIPTADVRAARIATEAVQYESSIFCVEFTIEHTDQRSHLLRNIGNDRDLIEEVQPDGTIIICTLLEWHGFSGGSEGTHKFRSPVTGELFDVEDELLTDIVIYSKQSTTWKLWRRHHRPPLAFDSYKAMRANYFFLRRGSHFGRSA